MYVCAFNRRAFALVATVIITIIGIPIIKIKQSHDSIIYNGNPYSCQKYIYMETGPYLTYITVMPRGRHGVSKLRHIDCLLNTMSD